MRHGVRLEWPPTHCDDTLVHVRRNGVNASVLALLGTVNADCPSQVGLHLHTRRKKEEERLREEVVGGGIES